MLKLEYEIEGQTISIPLKDGTFLVGRADTCDIVIKNPSVSKQHLRLTVSGDRVEFRDLGSANGTFLNGKRLENCVLVPGDVLRLGKVTIRVVGGGRPLDFTPSPPSPHAEETPPAEGFILATPPSSSPAGAIVPSSPTLARAAVEIVPPSSALPNAEKKKKILFGVAGGVILLLVVLLLIPSSSPSKPPEKPKSRITTADDYWQAMSEGARAFKRGDYENAYKLWSEMDTQWKAAREKNPELRRLFVGEIYARVAEPFLQAGKGEPPAGDWNKLREELLDLEEQGALPADLSEFTVDVLAMICSKENRNQRTFFEAQRLKEKGLFDEAKQKYQEISPGSVYSRFIEAAIEACDLGKFKAAKERAIRASERGALEEAIREGEEALKMKPDAELESLIHRWRVVVKIEGMLDEIRRYIVAGKIEDIEKAKALLERLCEEYPDEPLIVKEKEGILKTIEERLFSAAIENYYRSGDTAALEEMRAKANDSLTVRNIFDKYDRIQAEFKAANEAEAKGEFVEMHERWKKILQIEPDTENAFRKRAALLLEQKSEAWIAEKEYELARQAITKGEYGKARKKLSLAAKHGISIAAEVEMLQKRGVTLFNEGINLYHQKQYALAKERLFQARDCFEPTDEWFEKIDKRIREYKFEPSNE